MTARPRLRAALKSLEAIAAKEDLEDWVEWLAMRRADGKSMQSIADEIGLSRGMLYLCLKKTLRDDQRAALEIAAKEGAEALVDDAMHLADNARPQNTAEASALKTRVELRKWLAGKRDRKFADAVTLQQLNIGTLHLQALQAGGHRNALPRPRQDEVVVEQPEVEE